MLSTTGSICWPVWKREKAPPPVMHREPRIREKETSAVLDDVINIKVRRLNGHAIRRESCRNVPEAGSASYSTNLRPHGRSRKIDLKAHSRNGCPAVADLGHSEANTPWERSATGA